MLKTINFVIKNYSYGVSEISGPLTNMDVKKYWTAYEIGNYKINYFHLKGKGYPYPPSIKINGYDCFDWKNFEFHNVDIMLSYNPLKIVPQENFKKFVKEFDPNIIDTFNYLNVEPHKIGFFVNWENESIEFVH